MSAPKRARTDGAEDLDVTSILVEATEEQTELEKVRSASLLPSSLSREFSCLLDPGCPLRGK